MVILSLRRAMQKKLLATLLGYCCMRTGNRAVPPLASIVARFTTLTGAGNTSLGTGTRVPVTTTSRMDTTSFSNESGCEGGLFCALHIVENRQNITGNNTFFILYCVTILMIRSTKVGDYFDSGTVVRLFFGFVRYIFPDRNSRQRFFHTPF